MTAIVGRSGAGKSTLIHLLTRLYSPSSGQILIDGVDLESYHIQSWREKLGVVSQSTIIFNDSAYQNICFGSERSEEEVLEVCKIAGCEPFIKQLPRGLKTDLGEQGYRLSGGEAQRISIARALIRRPEILIFDEATSNLDSQNEHLIHETLQTLKENTTLIVIAHRLSTIREADHIILLDHGKLAEEGTHEELLAKQLHYAELWSHQSQNKKKRVVLT